MENKICTQCGHENNQSANFCKSCGTPLQDVEKSVEQKAEEVKQKLKKTADEVKQTSKDGMSTLFALARPFFINLKQTLKSSASKSLTLAKPFLKTKILVPAFVILLSIVFWGNMVKAYDDYRHEQKVEKQKQEKEEKRAKEKEEKEERHAQNRKKKEHLKELNKKIKSAKKDYKLKELLAALEEIIVLYVNLDSSRQSSIEKMRKLTKAVKNLKKIVALQDMTASYSDVLWELGNPLLHSFKAASYTEYKNNEDLLLYIDNYIKAAKKSYIKESLAEDKVVPVLPVLEDYQSVTSTPMYPKKPVLTKDEFEKRKDFENRETEAVDKWNKEIAEIDSKYKMIKRSRATQDNKKYEEALEDWKKSKIKIEEENKQNRIAFKEKLNNVAQKMEYWRWQAVLRAMGTQSLSFERLDYDSEKEMFEYVLSGTALDLNIEGTIDVPADKAKAFKEAMLSADRRIKFIIKDNHLLLSGLGYKEENYSFNITSNMKLLLVDKEKLVQRKQEIILEQEKHERDMKLAKEKEKKEIKRLRKAGVYTAHSLMWQDNRNAKILNRNWKSAKSYCGKLVLGGFSDWRLPYNGELNSLDTSALKNVVYEGYWTISKGMRTGTHGTVTMHKENSRNGSSGHDYHKYKFRCVRDKYTLLP